MKRTTTAIATTAAGLLCVGLLVAPHATASPTPTPGAVAGGRTSGDTLFPNQGNSGYDVRHYDVAIAYASNGSITATTTIDATVTAAQAVSEFSLDLEGLTVSGVKVNGTAAAFSRVADAATTTYKLIVTPAAPITGAFTTAVTYAGTPTAHTDPDGSTEGWTRTQSGGVVALNEPVGAMTWFANNNTPTDKATFTTRLTVPYVSLPGFPTNQTAVSTGSLKSTTTDASTRTFTWEQPNQQASYLALAAIGTYTAAEADVPLSVGTTHEWSYANTALEVPSNFGARRAQLSPMLKAIERNYGTYPGASTGMVVDSSTLGYALETQDRPYFENNIGQNTLIHELVHQWFGNAVSPTDWSDIWLNEGPATFVATQVTAELYGGASTETTYFNKWNTTAADSNFWKTPVAGFDDPKDLFGSPTYERGAMTLEAMRSALGEGTFLEIMSTWIERYNGGDASTAEWIALSEEISGRDLTAFFQDWLYDTDKPAWPSRWDLALTSTPVSGATLDAGDPFTVALRATNTGKVSQAGSFVTVDATSLLAQADLGTLPAGVTRNGSTLVWAVPDNALAASKTVTIPATVVTTPTTSEPIVLEAYAVTLGATCASCTSTLAVNGPDVPLVLSPTPKPTITGLTRTGQRLTATIGEWAEGAALTYEWRRDGAAIADATGTTYDLTPGDVGSAITLAVTGTKAEYAPVTKVSAPTATVRKGVQTQRKRPTIDGKPRVGDALRAVLAGRDAGTTTGYQWYAAKKAIRGATSAWFSITKKQRGKRIKVITTTTKPGYATLTKVSKPTKKIKKRR